MVDNGGVYRERGTIGDSHKVHASLKTYFKIFGKMLQWDCAIALKPQTFLSKTSSFDGYNSSPSQYRAAGIFPIAKSIRTLWLKYQKATLDSQCSEPLRTITKWKLLNSRMAIGQFQASRLWVSPKAFRMVLPDLRMSEWVIHCLGLCLPPTSGPQLPTAVPIFSRNGPR